MSARGPDQEHDSEQPFPRAELRTHTLGAGTLWLTQTPPLALWKGEVGLLDWLRLESKDGAVHELKLPRGEILRVGRHRLGMPDPPQIAHDLFLSSQAALLRHDGRRWFLSRRPECHAQVPVVVGTRALAASEEAPLVHGTFVQIGHLRGTLADRRYVMPAVPAGVVDAATGLLARAGFEQEIASALALARPFTLVLFAAGPSTSREPDGAPPSVRLAEQLHRARPRAAVLHDNGVAGLLLEGDRLVARAFLAEMSSSLSPPTVAASGHWQAEGDERAAASELERALAALERARSQPAPREVSLHEVAWSARVASRDEIEKSLAESRKRTLLLLGLEDQASLARMGGQIIPALSDELLAMALTRATDHALVAKLAPGVVGVVVAGHESAQALGADLSRDWHARPPLVDGQLELPRALSAEITNAGTPRADELARECADPQGALSALAGSLPFPIAGRVSVAIAASSALERIKLLFDVLEGAWRFVALVLAAAHLGQPSSEADPDLARFVHEQRTRTAYPLGKWRELARLAARGFPRVWEPMGRLAESLLGRGNESDSIEALANELHPLRNKFAHGVYSEARARADLAGFETTVKSFLRALRPLSGWTLITVERTEPDLYGDTQIVDYVDHTGPFAQGTRRRVVLITSVRLANISYFARLREGLFVPLEPFVRRVPQGEGRDGHELLWSDHLPRVGPCSYSPVVSGPQLTLLVDARRLPPRLRDLATLSAAATAAAPLDASLHGLLAVAGRGAFVGRIARQPADGLDRTVQRSKRAASCLASPRFVHLRFVIALVAGALVGLSRRGPSSERWLRAPFVRPRGRRLWLRRSVGGQAASRRRRRRRGRRGRSRATVFLRRGGIARHRPRRVELAKGPLQIGFCFFERAWRTSLVGTTRGSCSRARRRHGTGPERHGEGGRDEEREDGRTHVFG
jgi:hypothetical protein